MNIRVALFSLGVFGCFPALGQSPDPPSAVGRAVQVEGRVDIQGSASPAPEAVERNWPLIGGDRIRTGAAGRAELVVGPARLWVDQNSTLTILELSPDSVRLKVETGTVHLQLSETASSPSAQLDAPAATFELIKPGDYRVDLDGSRTTLAVLTGEAHVATDLSRFEQFGSEEVSIEADGSANIRKPASAHPLERWIGNRPRQRRGGQVERHVARGLVGYEELEAHGAWIWEPELGMVWTPRSTGREWTPYRFGHWIWKAPWGWTWIDAAPWGFATTHYGRWTRIDGRWAWIPGARQLEPVFAPGLVKWLADDDGELIGWFPLDAREEYVPPYPASRIHQRKLNTFTSVGGRMPAATSSTLNDAERSRAVTWTRRSAFVGHAPPTTTDKHLAGEPARLGR